MPAKPTPPTAPAAPILRLKSVHKRFGPAEIIRGVDLALQPQERHAIIGPNGAGKSTLFHLVSGQLAPSAGEIWLRETRIDGQSPQAINRMGLARSFQITNIFPKLSVFENIRLAVMRPFGLQLSLWRRLGSHPRIRQETELLLERVRLAHRAHTLAGAMSYSEQRALEIAMTLASQPQVILLDEPMAGMSHEETAYTAALIREVTQGRALLVVEHDMAVVFALSDRISVLVYGQVIATGTPAEIKANPQVKEAYLGEEVGDAPDPMRRDGMGDQTGPRAGSPGRGGRAGGTGQEALA